MGWRVACGGEAREERGLRRTAEGCGFERWVGGVWRIGFGVTLSGGLLLFGRSRAESYS